MTTRKALRYVFGAVLAAVAAGASWKFGFRSWPAAVAIPTTMVLATLVAFGPELYEGIRLQLPGDTEVDFGGDEDQG